MMIHPSKLGIKKLKRFLKLIGFVFRLTMIEMVIRIKIKVKSAIEKMTISNRFMGNTLLPSVP
jgi:hypothetical protein